MGRIKVEGIIGYEIDAETVCTGCLQQGEDDDLEENQYILESNRNDEELIFCDRCNKRI